MIYSIILFSLALVWGGGAMFVLAAAHPSLMPYSFVITGFGSVVLGLIHVILYMQATRER